MADADNKSISLKELREESKPSSFGAWMRKHLPFLFNIRSLFYFFLFVFILGFAWMAYSLFTNSFTQLYGWDYTWQFINFSYYFWDVWHKFFKTGVFELYSYSTFLGTDNIGSNSYYGLFDPFVFLIVFFPRAWVPQIYAFAAMLKGAVGALTMRAYLKYMGISEAASRVGAVAFAYCGYLNFMVGFPVTVSMVCTVPLILLGIEKVIKEKKIGTLIGGLFLLGIISFFFLVVLCIFGVLYAMWRYFQTFGKRKGWKDQLSVIGLGVAGFAIGIMACAWTLLPSIRETSLSGRTNSMGAAYLGSLKHAAIDQILKNLIREPFTFFSSSYGEMLQGFKTVFLRMFEMVGDNPGRELMSLVSFFYPTAGYLWLPLYTDGGYDAWTASLFCYTPMVIFFFYAMLGSIRRKQWSHLLALALGCYLCFTTFAYFFFYAFTGDGYGRWFIVLVPLIIYYACSELDRIKTNPKWQLPAATLMAVGLTILTYFIVYWSLYGKTFVKVNDPSGYWRSEYLVPPVVNYEGKPTSLLWIVIYQIALVVIESAVVLVLHKKKCLNAVLIGFISFETIVCGNLSFVYGSSWSYQYSLNGGAKNSAQAVDVFKKLKDYNGDDYHRTYSDSCTGTDNAMAFGYNGSRTFHSLYNYGLVDLGHFSHFIGNDYYSGTKAYGETVKQHVWSAFYGNKRLGMDLASGYKYYAVKDEGYGNWDNDNFAYNVPFGSKVVAKNEAYKVYESPNAIELGHAVELIDGHGRPAVYRTNVVNEKIANMANESDFFRYDYGEEGWKEITRNEMTYLNGVIMDDDAELPTTGGHEVYVGTAPTFIDSINGYFTNISANYNVEYYETVEGFGLNIDDPGKFLDDPSLVVSKKTMSKAAMRGFRYKRDDGKLVMTSSSPSGYYNDDKNGAYFLMSYDAQDPTRIYFIGDEYDADGNLVKENALLSYDFNMIDNWCGSNETGGKSYSGLFGFYVRGRAKHIVYCAKGEGEIRAPSSQTMILKMERSQYDSLIDSLRDEEHSLNHVARKGNNFTFDVNYSYDKFVITTLGYDAGWQAYRFDESGKKHELKTYRIDGGFVGFFAPEGKYKCALEYHTKHLKEGVLLAAGGIFVFVGYEVLRRLLNKKRKEA